LALRIGRVCFNYILREYGGVLGFTVQTFKLLPLKDKIIQVVNELAKVFNSTNQQKVTVNVKQTQITWNSEQCGICWDRHSDQPVCYLIVGMLQEALYWVSGGKYFAIEETECQAMGNTSCKFVISRLPLS
jgi:predicted hydrocarbon binding protein